MASFADGQLVVPGPDGSKVSVPEHEILFVVKGQQPGQGTSYQVARLHESTPAPSGGSGGSASPPPPPPLPRYAFSTVRLREEDVQALPRRFLDKHVLPATPRVLPSASTSLHVVVSTGSGLRQAEPFYDSVLGPLLRDVFGLTAAEKEKAEKEYSLLITDSKDSIATFARALASAPDTHRAPTVILLSGDGGVVDLLNGGDGVDGFDGADVTSRPKPTIALLPLGTGNALFHSLHKPAYEAAAAAAAATAATTAAVAGTTPSPLVHGLRTLFRGKTAALPSFEATFAPGSRTVSYTAAADTDADADADADAVRQDGQSIERLRGAIVASYGFHAQLVWESDTPAYRKHGEARFGILAGELIKESHAYRTDVAVTTRTTGTTGTTRTRGIGHAFSYVLATLVSELQQGFTISPASQPLDGQLRLVHFGAVGGSRTMDIMKLAYSGGAHVREADVGYEAIDAVEVQILEEDPRWRKVCIDGTIVEIPQGGWMKVRRAAQPVLDIITPV